MLLDVNALLALLWPHHDHHAAMQAWFTREGQRGFASCALTQSGFIRVSCQPAFSGQPLKVDMAHEVLQSFTDHKGHRFVSNDFSFDQVNAVCTGGIVGHRQVTDAWLLATAKVAKTKLLTFDTGIARLLSTPAERDKLLHFFK